MIPERTAFGEPLLDAQELADALGMTRRWVYAQVEENRLPAYKLGRSLAFEVSPCGRGWPSVASASGRSVMAGARRKRQATPQAPAKGLV